MWTYEFQAYSDHGIFESQGKHVRSVARTTYTLNL